MLTVGMSINRNSVSVFISIKIEEEMSFDIILQTPMNCE